MSYCVLKATECWSVSRVTGGGFRAGDDAHVDPTSHSSNQLSVHHSHMSPSSEPVHFCRNDQTVNVPPTV